MGVFVLIPMLIVLFAVSSRAEPSETERCGQANSTQEIVQCLDGRTKFWDDRLNAAYQRVLSSLSQHRREQLRAAERLWIQYRDANCAYYAGGEGTISRIDAAECMRHMTQQRARELENIN